MAKNTEQSTIWKERRRFLAVELKNKGWMQKEIATALDVSEGTVSSWLKIFKGRGEDGLHAQRQIGRPSNLIASDKQGLLDFLSHGAEAYGFQGDLWTCQRVGKVIEREFGVSYHRSHIARLLKELKWTHQQPMKRASQRNEVEIIYWKDSVWKDNVLLANNEHFYIVFIDEAGFMLEPLTRHTWAQRGHTPVLKVSENRHDRISVIGALTINMKTKQFGFLFHLSQDNTNFRGHSVVPFLDHLYATLNGRIHLVRDSIKIHTAEPVNIFLALHPSIKVFFFPPYAPELNPVDNVWGYIKYNRLANFCPHDLVELRKHVRAELFRIQKRPDLLESLFRHTGLNLD